MGNSMARLRERDMAPVASENFPQSPGLAEKNRDQSMRMSGLRYGFTLKATRGRNGFGNLGDLGLSNRLTFRNLGEKLG